MRILIATGIYPPAVGGPSQYAKNVKMEWEKKGYMVKVRTFRFERYLPSGFRHFFYFLKIIPEVLWCDFIFMLAGRQLALQNFLERKSLSVLAVTFSGKDTLKETKSLFS